ncbi:hypothetical protein BV25DRAFT_1912773 [Artomyces pyxidatus]|uniref:Uncharacterized protein n=1 Tax=Artomyces pyxidatus TaxID=48021 RepID=A0ACB8TE96_9AGAM|nr:hypothetical protein BV25DRAFT_1912773 [Artomyces pyxidatus]
MERRPETLEVETDEARERRLQQILESLNAPGDAPPQPPSLKFDFGNRETFVVPPPTEPRLQAFLPELEASNAQLLQRDPSSIDIEHIEDDDEQYIQMDLGLGVFEERRSAESGSDGDSDSSSSESDGETSTSSSSDSDSEADSSTTSPAALRPVKGLPKRARPQIEVLHSTFAPPSP